MIHTKIQWCHDTVNPLMGCGGCELFPSPEKILAQIDAALAAHRRGYSGKSREQFRELIGTAHRRISSPLRGHSRSLSTTNIWHLRHEFCEIVRSEHGQEVAHQIDRIMTQAVSCYAARLHLNKGRSILNPSRGANSGYAPTFESITQFAGRVWQMARSRDPGNVHHPDKEWLDGCRRLIFVSDMGDAFSRESDFAFLEEEVIAPIRSPEGQRFFWLWLTKRPDRMARFGERIGGFPNNVCAMTTITGPDKLRRIDELRRVPASIRGLSGEPLWDRLPPEQLELEGITWMIVGGESGRYDSVRPFDLAWARELRDVCDQSGIAFFVKQLGRRPVEGGLELRLQDKHGGDWDEWPKDLQLRQMPMRFMRNQDFMGRAKKTNKRKPSSKRSFASLEKSYDRIFIYDLKNVLAHELGHYIVTTALGGNATISIWKGGGGDPMGALSVSGNCKFDYADTFERSCIAWGGEAAKLICDEESPNAEDLSLRLMDQFTLFEEEFSASDLAAIKSYTDPEKSLDRSLEILVRQADFLRSLLSQLAVAFLSTGCDHLDYPDI